MKKGYQVSFLALSIIIVAIFFLYGAVSPTGAEDDPDEIKDDIESIENKLEKAEAEKAKLQQNLGQIQISVNSTDTAIRKTEGAIQETKVTISRKEKEIGNIEDRIGLQREMIRNLIQEYYYTRRMPLIEMILSQSEFSGFLGQVEGLAELERKIAQLSLDLKADKEKLQFEKNSLEDQREEHERLLALKEDQKQDLLADKYATQRDIARKEATIGELQEKLSELRKNLSDLLGTSYDASDIIDAAKFASKETGVRKDFILGMLVVESDLGRFTGGCYAKDSRMSGTRLEKFKQICEELDYDWKKRKVSCPPRSYKGTGGAMGVAQFMSDTWMGYKSSIASKTGHNPPDPWNLTDGVMAMGLKLARGGATKKSGECNAAKLYLSGTTSSKYNWYCDRVLYWANNYENKL